MSREEQRTVTCGASMGAPSAVCGAAEPQMPAAYLVIAMNFMNVSNPLMAPVHFCYFYCFVA